MSSPTPASDLDRAILAMQRSRAAIPEFYRQLTVGQLWFLVRYHPEIEGELIAIHKSSPLPFASLQDKQGEVVPLFSSAARLDEGLQKGRVPPRTYSAAAMPALQILELLGRAQLRAVINKSCATGQITISPDLMRDLANGTALAPSPVGQRQHGRSKILNPADYPTDLIQPAFELMRRHGNFRAAWIVSLAQGEPQPVNGRGYRLLLLMDPRDDALLHDLNLTVQAARSRADVVELGLVDETDRDFIARLFRQAQPFYTAADYHPPVSEPPPTPPSPPQSP